MLQEKKIEYIKRKRSKYQRIWTYIRRNSVFRTGDVLIVCEVSYAYLQKFLKYLEAAAYISVAKKVKGYTNREYRFLKNTGINAPILYDWGLHDINTDTKYELFQLEQREFLKPPFLTQILETIQKTNCCTKQELGFLSKVGKKNLNKYWEIIVKTGACKDSFVEDGDKYFIFDELRAKAILKAINNGAYEKDKELKQLWKLTNS